MEVARQLQTEKERNEIKELELQKKETLHPKGA